MPPAQDAARAREATGRLLAALSPPSEERSAPTAQAAPADLGNPAATGGARSTGGRGGPGRTGAGERDRAARPWWAGPPGAEPVERRPSLLPGWTVGHVLTHLARNADALVNLVNGRPMYAGETRRDDDIERGAGRPLAALLEDVRTASARLDAAFGELTEADWRRTVELRGGLTDRLSGLPFRRWAEVELHRVDLGLGYHVDDLPRDFVDRQLTALAQRFAGHPGIAAAIELRPGSGGAGTGSEGALIRTGAPGGEVVAVSGSPAALLGWLTGRGGTRSLRVRGSLPALPPL
ncbi:maleylpyruvate isomerase family mycothiol-dependent enzyme [Streptomyces sp. AJS327]|nr:maleylpyruvate isomerase family mycothiol-dependent enzyme [Streptomyces sp. AJS327]